MYGDPKEMDNFLEENFGKEELSKIYEGRENSSDIAIAYFPEINDYNGSASIQIQIRNYCRIS